MYFKIENYPGQIGARKITKEEMDSLQKHLDEDFDEIFEHMKKVGIVSNENRTIKTNNQIADGEDKGTSSSEPAKDS
jgi:hypothetical protein